MLYIASDDRKAVGIIGLLCYVFNAFDVAVTILSIKRQGILQGL